MFLVQASVTFSSYAEPSGPSLATSIAVCFKWQFAKKISPIELSVFTPRFIVPVLSSGSPSCGFFWPSGAFSGWLFAAESSVFHIENLSLQMFGDKDFLNDQRHNLFTDTIFSVPLKTSQNITAIIMGLKVNVVYIFPLKHTIRRPIIMQPHHVHQM